MHASVREIFEDAGASPEDLLVIEGMVQRVGLEVRDLIDAASAGVNPSLMLAVRVYLCRVIHADMEKKIGEYR